MSVPTIEVQRGRVIEMQRDDARARTGSGLLRGMAVIWKHWQRSFSKNRDTTQIHGTFTLEYPEERPKLAQTFRNMPILLFDDQSGHELCTSCYQCQRICPPQVIHMTQAKDPVTGKSVPAVAEFVIEYDACMSCGFCAEVCPFDAIKMDHEFELSTDDHAGLTRDKNALLRPVSYYEGLAPTLWAEAAAGAQKKLQGNIKRRPDVIGIAPALTEKIAARRAELAAEAAAAPAAAPAAAAPPAAAAGGARLTPEEKAAKLAAMRAAKAGAAAPAAETPAPAAEAPADAKAAKLAAIRAANAAKAGTAAPAAETPAPAAAAPPAGDDKAAKLAAIRAANAAKKAADAQPAPAAAADVSPAVEAAPEAPLDAKAAKLAAIRAANAAKKAQSGNDGTA